MKIENGDGANPFLFVLLRTSPRANYWVYFHKIGRDGASGPPTGGCAYFLRKYFHFFVIRSVYSGPSPTNADVRCTPLRSVYSGWCCRGGFHIRPFQTHLRSFYADVRCTPLRSVYSGRCHFITKKIRLSLHLR